MEGALAHCLFPVEAGGLKFGKAFRLNGPELDAGGTDAEHPRPPSIPRIVRVRTSLRAIITSNKKLTSGQAADVADIIVGIKPAKCNAVLISYLDSAGCGK
jgi:hypothetical protein